MKISVRHVALVMLPIYLSLTNAIIFSHKKSDFAPLAVMNDTQKNDLRACGSSCENICAQICERGKRGKKGKRGKRGHPGANTTSLAELFLTAPMLAGCGEGPTYPPYELVYFNFGCFSVPVWSMLYFEGSVGGGGWGAFDVPIDLDNTQPVTAVVHVLVTSSTAATGNANIEIDTEYLSNNELGGTSFDDTQTSGDFTVTPVSPTDDFRQITIPISLNPALLVPGDWGFISATRIPAMTNEFQDALWLSSISIQYSRLTS